ncbi:MAG: adenylate/guanylate cyclase domain-containing protein, partial [Thermoanaerobaculia bacterium]|nr:adenylate/guanylate cyclase domain-containing protein [Thermoanaerobaculia bacterium]
MVDFDLVNEARGETIRPPRDGWAVVGRAGSADFSVVDRSISRLHAKVSLQPRGIAVRDLGSTNGTFVNGREISESVAGEGDEVTFGKVAFRVRRSAADPQLPPETFAEQVEPTQPMAASPTPPPPDQTIFRPVTVAGSGLGDNIVKITDSSAGVPLPAASPEAGKLNLELLLEISKELSKQQPVDDLLHRIVDIITQIMDVHRVSVLLLDQESKELVPLISMNKGKATDRADHLPRSILDKVVQDRVAVLTDDAMGDDRFDGRSVILQNVCSAMCSPLLRRTGEVVGAIYVDNLSLLGSFKEVDLDFLASFSSIAGAAIENSQLSEELQAKAVAVSNFERYFAPELAQQIARDTGSTGLGGVRKPIANLFTDIRGFTPMAEGMEPDEVVALLNGYFSEMVEVIFEYGGTLDKFIGDAVMANWGAPMTRPDDPDRALRAAVEMQRRLLAFNEAGASVRPRIEMGIGVNYGEVFVGNIGSPRRLEYTVIGDAVNVASRLCS